MPYESPAQRAQRARRMLGGDGSAPEPAPDPSTPAGRARMALTGQQPTRSRPYNAALAGQVAPVEPQYNPNALYDPSGQDLSPSGLVPLQPVQPDDLTIPDVGSMPQPINDTSPTEGYGRALAGYHANEGFPLAQQDYSRAAASKSLMQRGPAQERYLQALMAQPEPVHGWKAHLLGALKGLVLSDGKIGGAIYGAIDPNMINRAYYRLQTGALAAPAEAERAMQADKIKQASEIAKLSGYDPTTGLRTPEADYKDQLAQLRQMQLENQQERTNIARTSAESLNAVRASRKALLDYDVTMRPLKEFAELYKSGALNGDPERMRAYAIRAKIPNPETIPEHELSGMLQAFTDEFFRINLLNKGTGEVKKTGITDVKKTEEANKTARATAQSAAAAAREASQAAAKDDEDANTAALRLLGKGPTRSSIEDATMFQTRQDKYNADFKAAKQRFLDARAAARAAAAPAAPAPAGPAQTQKGPAPVLDKSVSPERITEGSRWTYNGRVATITYKLPNGNPIPNGKFRPVYE